MKKFITLMIVICIMLCCVGCVGIHERIINNHFIQVPMETDLYYDTNTKVVYIILEAGYLSPYYADNGLPYLYNTETNSLEKNTWVEISGIGDWFNH